MSEIILEVKKRGSHITLVRDFNNLIYKVNNKTLDKAPYNLKNLASFSSRIKNTIKYLNK